MKKDTIQFGTYNDLRRNKLAEARVLHLQGGVGFDTTFEMFKELAFLEHTGKDPITIYLNCYGGEVYNAFAIYDRITGLRKKGVDINIITTGACMSAALIILQSATERIATENTSFLLHELAGGNSGSLSQQEDLRKEFIRLQDRIFAIIAKRSGTDKKKLAKASNRKDYFFDVHQAKELGLIDTIIEE